MFWAISRIWNETWLASFFYKPCNYELFVKQSLNMEMAIVMARVWRVHSHMLHKPSLIEIFYDIFTYFMYWNFRRRVWTGLSILTLMSSFILLELVNIPWDSCSQMCLEMLIWLSFQITWVELLLENLYDIYYFLQAWFVGFGVKKFMLNTMCTYWLLLYYHSSWNLMIIKSISGEQCWARWYQGTF